MATPKRSSANRGKSAANRSRAASASTAASSKTTKSAQSAKSAGSTSRAPKKTGTTRAGTASSRASAAPKNGSTRARGSANRRTASSQNGAALRRQDSTRRTAQTHDGVAESVKHAGTSALRAANRASGPALTVAAAAAGIAGGLMLRQRSKPTMRDGLGARSRHVLHDIDPTSILEGLGKASIQLSQRSKSIAHDIERVADRAERLGKVLR